MSRLAVLIGAFLVLAGSYLFYARSQVLEPERLGERVAGALGEADLRVAIAPTIASAIGDVSPENEPTADEVVEVLADPRVGDEFAAAAAAAAELVIDGKEETPALGLAEVTATAISVSEGAPVEALAGEELRSARLELTGADAVLDAIDKVESVGWVCFPLLLLGLLLLAAAPLAGLTFTAASVAAASGLGIAALFAGRAAVAGRFDDPVTVAAIEATWDGLFGDLLVWTAIAGGLAIVLAIFAALVRD